MKCGALYEPHEIQISLYFKLLVQEASLHPTSSEVQIEWFVLSKQSSRNVIQVEQA